MSTVEPELFGKTVPYCPSKFPCLPLDNGGCITFPRSISSHSLLAGRTGQLLLLVCSMPGV